MAPLLGFLSYCMCVLSGAASMDGLCAEEGCDEPVVTSLLQQQVDFQQGDGANGADSVIASTFASDDVGELSDIEAAAKLVKTLNPLDYHGGSMKADAFNAQNLSHAHPSQSSSSDNVDAKAILPSVECVRVISLNGSKSVSLLTGELKRLGLWSRTTVQIEQPDPEGGMAGCFRAHVRAWALGQQCSNQLVLEDDAFFDNDTVDISSARAEAFLQGGFPYDLLRLGWSLFDGQVRVSKIGGADCAFQLHGDFIRTHAYVISNDAMQRLSSLEFAGEHIDVYLARTNDTKHATIRPMSAQQRYHKTAIPWSDNQAVQAVQAHNQKMKADPAFTRREIEDPVYQASGYGDLCAI